jgi:HEAT repeat protein
MACGIRRLEAFKTIEILMVRGKDLGRRAACAALAQFSGADANAMVLRALEDPDPQVQAIALSQLRQRGIPGALSRLMRFAESHHEVVRDAARSQLDEFSIDRFLAAFDTLHQAVRQSTAAVVRKVDPQSLDRLRVEMSALARSRRLRAIAAAQAMGLVAELQDSLVKLLEDDDHMVRTEAARALAQCNTHHVREALRFALADRSVMVQQAAQESLELMEAEGRE